MTKLPRMKYGSARAIIRQCFNHYFEITDRREAVAVAFPGNAFRPKIDFREYSLHARAAEEYAGYSIATLFNISFDKWMGFPGPLIDRLLKLAEEPAKKERKLAKEIANMKK